MLSTAERRFIRSWEEQRQGGRLAYYLLYIIAGTVILAIGVSFVMAMIRFALPRHLWVIPIASFLIALLLTHYSWVRNERRFRLLIRREMGGTGQ